MPEGKDAANPMGLWIAVGVALGAGVGTAIHNMGLGIGVGIALGAMIGAVQQQKIRKDRKRSSSYILIRGALERLKARPFGSFVIIEEAETGRFVQFAGSQDEPLLLDLPLQALSQEEKRRAFELFSEEGHPNPTPHAPRETTADPEPLADASFNIYCGSDVDRASALALTVLHRVYKIEDGAQLKVTEE